MEHAMTIGEAAEAAGVSAKMIRHYEEIGLVPAAARTEAGYRQYTARDVSVLRFIRQSRRLGFSTDQIADLLGLWSDSRRASRNVKAVAQRHIDELEQKMREMAEMAQALGQLVASCQGDDHPHCTILAGLAAHSPTAPDPGSVAPGAPRKAAAARRAPGGKAPAPDTASPSAGHAGLMAWTRQLHPGHAGH